MVIHRTTLVYLVITILFSAIFFLWDLGKNGLIEFDEGIYAVVSKNLVLSGDPLRLTLRGDVPWFDKPPLYFWLSALSMKVLGFSSLAPRIPSAFFGIGTVITTFLIGKMLFNNQIGFMAALILSSTIGFLYYGRLGMVDVTLTFFLATTVLFLLAGRIYPKAFLWMGVSLGLAFLTKNLIALLILPPIVFYIFLDWSGGGKKKYLNRFFFSALLIASSIFLAWHLFMLLRFGEPFYSTYFTYHTFSRINTNIEGEQAPFLWYLKVIRTQFRIWYLFLYPALLWSIGRLLKGEKNYVIILLSVLVIFFAFSFSTSKLAWFILPIYPFLSLLVAVFLDRLFSGFDGRFRSIFLVLIFLTALLYNFKKLDKIISPDFTKGLVAGVLAKGKLNREKTLLVPADNYHVASYYSVSGPLIGKQPAEIEQLIKYYPSSFLLFERTHIPQGLDFPGYGVKKIGEFSNFVLLEKN